MIDLSKHSLAELRELQSQLGEQITLRQKEDISKVRQQIEALANSVGMTVDQIMSTRSGQTKKATKTVAARYRHPEQPELEWTGRGRQPRWITEYLEKSGKKIDSLLIA